MKESGWIKLDRKILTWEWYDDPNTLRLFIHLLLTVNWTDEKWHGVTIHRGERVTSYGKLAKELHINVKTARRCVDKLVSTGEISVKSSTQYTLFKVSNYNAYQAQTEHGMVNGMVTIEERKKNINNIQESKKGAQSVEGPIRKIQHVDNDPAGWLAKTRANIRKVNAEYGFDKGGQLSEVVADGKVFKG